MRGEPNRRELLRAATAAGVGGLALTAAASGEERPKTNGRIKQSVCRWCYGGLKLEKLAEAVKGLGYLSVELLVPDEVLVVKKFGLTCALLGGSNIVKGLNRKEHHDRLEKELRDKIEFCAAEGVPSVICMSGNREGMDDETGLKNCAEGLKRVLGLAETKGINLFMEGLNSKVDHKDYMYDHTAWGVELCKRVDSPRFKLLYDIYHMQIMEGDVIRTIRRDHQHIGHYHTGGNPGRNEIDDGQELNYAAICKAIVETKFTGFLAQEFIPKRDPVQSLEQAFRICDV